jgi:hypothetical protein
MRTSEWINISYMNLRIGSSSMFSNNLIDHLLSSLVLLWNTLYKYISKVTIRNFLFSYLDFSSTFHLKLSNSITAFAYNKTNTIVWHWDNISIGRRWPIRSHHTVIHLIIRQNLIVNLLCNI